MPADLYVFSSRMLKKSASGVLASLRGATYRSVRLASSFAAALPVERCVLAHRGGRVRTVAILSILDETIGVVLTFEAYNDHRG